MRESISISNSSTIWSMRRRRSISTFEAPLRFDLRSPFSDREKGCRMLMMALADVSNLSPATEQHGQDCQLVLGRVQHQHLQRRDSEPLPLCCHDCRPRTDRTGFRGKHSGKICELLQAMSLHTTPSRDHHDYYYDYDSAAGHQPSVHLKHKT